jgi:hypothetical protein
MERHFDATIASAEASIYLPRSAVKFHVASTGWTWSYYPWRYAGRRRSRLTCRLMARSRQIDSDESWSSLVARAKKRIQSLWRGRMCHHPRNRDFYRSIRHICREGSGVICIVSRLRAVGKISVRRRAVLRIQDRSLCHDGKGLQIPPGPNHRDQAGWRRLRRANCRLRSGWQRKLNEN